MLKKIILYVMCSVYCIFSFLLVGCGENQQSEVELVVVSSDYSLGDVYGSGHYKKGQEVTIVAVPKENAKFVEWSDENQEISRKIIIEQDMTIVGYFELKQNGTIFDYTHYNVSDYTKSIEDVFEQNFDCQTPENLNNWQELIGNSNVTVNDLSCVDNYLIALNKLTLLDSYDVSGSGKYVSVGTINLENRYSFDGNEYNNEFSSDGMIKHYRFERFQKGSTQVSCFKSKNDAENQTGQINYDLTNFQNVFGRRPNEIFSFVVSEKTFVNGSIEYLKENNQYKISIELDQILGTLCYCKEVKANIGLKDYPVFNSVKLNFIISDSWDLLKFNTDLEYTVLYGVPAPVHETIEYEFNY